MQADLVEDRLHLRLGLNVPPLLLLGQHVERRLGDVKVPLGDQAGHLAVEERHQEGPDVRAVDVGVAHHHDLAVAPLRGVLLVADPVADGGDDVPDLLVAQDPVEPGPLDVEDLPPERQDRLVKPVAAPFGGPAGGVALDEEQLARILVVGGAVHQLAGQAAAGKDALAVPDEVAGLAGGLAGLGGELGLGDDLLGGLRVLFEELRELVVDDLGDDPLDLAVAQLGLGLALELGVGHPDADDRGEAFLEVLAGDLQVLVPRGRGALA